MKKARCEYSYRSAPDALARFAFLAQVVRQSGAHPMKLDDVKVQVPSSRENASFIEWVDLCRMISKLGELLSAVLLVEYALPNIQVDGVRGGKNKIEVLRAVYGYRIGPNRYVDLVKDGAKEFGRLLEDAGWIVREEKKSIDA